MKKADRQINELLIDLEEIRAYRALQNEPFNFGTGVLFNNSTYETDSYYKEAERATREKIKQLTIKEIADAIDKSTKTKEGACNTIDILDPMEQGECKTSYRRKKEDYEKLKCLKYVKVEEEFGSWNEKRYHISKREKRSRKRAYKRPRKYRPYINLTGTDYRRISESWWFVY